MGGFWTIFQHATKHTNSASLPVVLVSSRHLLHFYDGSCCAPPHRQRLPAAGPPPGESGEVRDCDSDSAVSGRAKNPLPVHRSALEQREEEEEAEEREKEGEGQTAEAGEAREAREGGTSSPPSPHRAALPHPATATGFAIRMVLPNYPAAGRLRIRCQEQKQMS